MRKIIFASLILISGFFDFFTFYFNKLYHKFEINPIYLLTKNITLIFIIKFAVIFTIIYILIKRPRLTFFHSYFIVLCGIILIVAQSLGGVSNLKVQAEQPSTLTAMQPEQAVKTYAILSIFIVYLPMIISLSSFKIWEKLYLKGRIKNAY